MKYWSEVKIPFFSEAKQWEIAKYYYNPIEHKIHGKDFELLENQDLKINEEIGILQLDEQVKVLKEKIHDIVDTIINGDEVNINLAFTDSF
ncbi:MAG: hypothetical protein UW30_C0013G0020 [Candidatus Giovannonibacteria bacterium GW2011_GWA2_44_13b]|nr:MAG: hypothetical protein UW30_C0013G0020 [Candidatus Giovannonibacteria bacterium GW2011_GWA2_44_13b]